MTEKPTPANDRDETDLHDDELICPVTHLAYLRGTSNPHINSKGKAV